MLKPIRDVATACLLAIALASGCGDAQAQKLYPGQSINTGQIMVSDNGRHFAVMQPDGNFVVYHVDGRAIWSTNTTGLGAVTADMQHDGNFVLYDAQRRPIWSAGSNGPGRTFEISQVGRAMVTAPGNYAVWEASQPRYRDGRRRCHNPRTCAGGTQINHRFDF